MKKWIGVFLFCVAQYGTLLSDELPNTRKILTLNDFAGGLNTLFPSHKLPPTFSPFMRNVFIDDEKIETVNGYTVLGSSMVLSKVTGIFPFVLENGSVYFLVTDSSVTLETQDFNTWTFVSSGSNSGAILNWFQVRNKMWGANGLDSVITWDHATKSILDGTKGTPNVPKFRYGEYYQDRVFGLNVPGGASDLYYNSVISTDNIILAPDSWQAWPSINMIPVGRGDGTIGTGLFIYGGRLRAAKERSLYTIQGDNPSNYNAIKEEGQVGVASDESIALLDRNAYWLGQDGIYENGKRISDLIQPDVDTFQRLQSSILSNSWETQLDFSKGNFAFGSTAIPSGFITISTIPFMLNYNTHTVADLDADRYVTFPAGGGSIDFGPITSTMSVPANFKGFFGNGSDGSVKLWAKCICQPSQSADTFNLSTTLKNLRTGASKTYAVATGVNKANFGLTQVWATAERSNVIFDADDIVNGNVVMNMTITGDAASDPLSQFAVYLASTVGYADIQLVASSTFQYVSEVSTLNSITAWGNFDSVNNSNGGLINYFIRTSTSVVNIATKTWTPINPGATINEPLINRFVQWTSTIQSISTQSALSSNIDNVSISHVEGQASIQRPIAIDWNNRLWISVSTQSDATKREIYVKSKITNRNPDAWMPIDGVDACAFAKAGNVLYGGSCSTGTVLRLDYGTNFNGSSIRSIYKTPQLDFGDEYFDKEIYKYLISGEKNTNGVVTVGSSVNEGAVMNSTFSINGTGSFNRVVEGIRNKGKTLDLTVSENDLDQKMILHNISVIYEPTKVLSNK